MEENIHEIYFQRKRNQEKNLTLLLRPQRRHRQRTHLHRLPRHLLTHPPTPRHQSH